jgi:hypothetical protein
MKTSLALLIVDNNARNQPEILKITVSFGDYQQISRGKRDK